ncbi:unnamed protein product [Bursaphelenchus xylophilus]|nr:unnamed protein product [Bursaphelenchus xylophilus]CAG9124913.1 unnamed protein product [Bursaphelenchus xylophilus]
MSQSVDVNLNLEQLQQCMQIYYSMLCQQAQQSQGLGHSGLQVKPEVQPTPSSTNSPSSDFPLSSNFSIASLMSSTPNSSISNDSGISSPSPASVGFATPSQAKILSSTPARRPIRTQDGEEIRRDADGKYVCPICQKAFSRKFYLQTAHMNIHNNISPYQCRKCHRAFKDSSNRRNHEKICQIAPLPE